VWVNVKAPKGTRAVRVVVGSRHKRFRLHRAHGRLWTVRMGTWQFGPPFPGMVRVEAHARWRVCGRTRTVVRVVQRKQKAAGPMSGRPVYDVYYANRRGPQLGRVIRIARARWWAIRHDGERKIATTRWEAALALWPEG
jgi:hypothetical protein